MSEYTLHCFAQSGNAYKPALLLELAGADWQPRFVDYFGGETRTPAWRALNAMGEVPVLEHAGERLTQSGVILDYLAQRFPQYGPRDERERREVLRWLLWDNHKLTSYTATYRFQRTFLKSPEPAVVAEFGKRARGVGRARRAPRRARLRRRRAPRHRRRVARRLPVLGGRTRGRLERFAPGHRGVARADPRDAAVARPVRPDAGASAARRLMPPTTP